MNKQEKIDEILIQLGFLMRFANRINNTHPELVNDTIKVSIEKSKTLIFENAVIKNNEKLKQS
jgi:hypothetical protein